MCAVDRKGKVALVLEGGGMRGLYTGGVVDALYKQGITFDTCYGVSAGACNAMSFLSGQPGRNYRINTGYLSDPAYLSLHSYFKTGSLFGMEMIFHTIPELLDPLDWKTLRENPTTLQVGVTNCYTGKAEFYPLREKKHVSLLQASSSLPLLSRTVWNRKTPYLDGGIAAPIPVQQALAAHEKAVVVLTQPAGYRKKPNKLLPLIQKRYPDFPGLIRAVANRHIVYNKTLEELEKLEREGKVFIFRPEKAVATRTEKNRSKLTEMYLLGYADSFSRGTALKEWVK